jgi:hypothetical protein
VIQIVLSILPDITAALLTSTYDNLLALIEAKLAGKAVNDVWGVITCAINIAQRTPAAPMAQAMTQTNADLWKKAHPAKVTGKSQ